MRNFKIPLAVLTAVCAFAVLAVVITFLLPSPKKNLSAEAGNLEKVLKENNIQADLGKAGQWQPESSLPDIGPSDHAWGDLNNPVKMIIYSDFECPFCAGFAKTVKTVEENYKGKVVIAFRHKPLSFHEAAMPAAEASECAAEQGKFPEMYDLLFENAGNADLNIEQFRKDANQLGLDAGQFNACLDGHKYKSQIEDQARAGGKAGAQGTPTVFIDKEIYPGAVPFEDYTGGDGTKHEGLKSIIDRHLKK